MLPVYNAGDALRHCLASLAAQDLPSEAFAVVAVDDGSTDGSGELLDHYAADRPNVRVIHQDASGGPGGPRNLGTDTARGEFVFYLDADDELAPDALGLMVPFAREHRSDLVVVGRITVEDGRVIRPLGVTRVISDAPLRMAFASLTPHKLIRRELIVAHQIRFPEGRVTWEDGIFLSQVAPRARRISLLQDRVYYTKHRLPDRLSARSFQRGKARAAVEIVDHLRRADADATETDAIAFGLYLRLLRIWNAPRFLRLAPEKQDLLVATMHAAAGALLPASRDAELPYQLQLRSLAFRRGHVAAVIALVRSEQDKWPAAQLRRPVLLPILARAWMGKARRKTLQLRKHRRRS